MPSNNKTASGLTLVFYFSLTAGLKSFHICFAALSLQPLQNYPLGVKNGNTGGAKFDI